MSFILAGAILAEPALVALTTDDVKHHQDHTPGNAYANAGATVSSQPAMDTWRALLAAPLETLVDDVTPPAMRDQVALQGRRPTTYHVVVEGVTYRIIG